MNIHNQNMRRRKTMANGNKKDVKAEAGFFSGQK
jgi:hypothetical protein